MTPEQKAAYINAQSASMLVEMEGMKAENTHRMNCGNSIAYGYDAFIELITKYGLDPNSIVDYCFKS